MSTCVHVWEASAENCVCLYMECVGVQSGGWGYKDGFVDAHTHWQASMSAAPCVPVDMLCCIMRFPKNRVMDTFTPTSSLHKHAAKHSGQKQRESADWPCMYAAVCDPYLFLWVLQAASHHHVTHGHAVRPPNTDSLYSHSTAWERPSDTHYTTFIYNFKFNFQWCYIAKCIYSSG